MNILIDHNEGCVHWIRCTFFTDIYAKKKESLKINHWFRQVMFFENWSTLAFLSILGKLLIELCFTKIRKIIV